MKKVFKILLALLIISAIYYGYQSRTGADFETIIARIQSGLSRIFGGFEPCEEPIPYQVAAFDQKFNISEEYFLSAIKEAEAIWEKPYGGDLFVHAPTDTGRDTLKINLIYDFRQEATTKLAGLGIVVKDTRASYDELKAKYNTLKGEYEKDRNEFNKKVSDFNNLKEDYEEDVKYWNDRGGAPEKEYESLEARRRELDNMSKELLAMERDINNRADEINALVVALNRLVTTLNLSVDKYNTTNDARGESFEEGVYISDGATQEIDIYEFSSHEKLVRVLAHEFGHALGIDHLPDPKAIMYELNQSNSTTLAEADIVALRTRCGVDKVGE